MDIFYNNNKFKKLKIKGQSITEWKKNNTQSPTALCKYFIFTKQNNLKNERKEKNHSSPQKT